MPALLSAVVDDDRETGILAVEALGKLKAPVLDVAQALLPLPEQERWARLVPALFRFKESATVRIAERGLALPDPDLHARAAYALARDPLPEGLPPLRGLLADPNPQVRAWAARGDRERAFGVKVEFCALIAGYQWVIWALSGFGYVWPIWPMGSRGL